MNDTTQRLVWMLLASLPLSACSTFLGDEGFFPDRTNEYANSQTLAPLQIPEGVAPPPRNNIYVLPPEVPGKVAKGDMVLRPKPLKALDAEQMIRVQSLEGDSWIVAELGTGEVWPRIRYFLESNKIGLDVADGKGGTLETGWLTSQTQPDRFERFLIEVFPGVQQGSSEVHVQQAQTSRAEAQAGVAVKWDGKSDDSERERWMILEVANYLAQEGAQQSISLLAQGISESSRVTTIAPANGPAYVELQLPFDRAWASMALALAKAEFDVVDRNLSKGLYLVAFNPQVLDTDKPGLFGKIFGKSPDVDENAGKVFELTIEKITTDKVHIFLTPVEGVEVTEEQRIDLLDRIKDYIS